MKNFKDTLKRVIVKHGGAIAVCAFACVTIAANSPCLMPYYEPEEPAGLDKYKKFNK